MRRHLGRGKREDRALAVLMAACVLLFAARLPALAREAYITGEELNPMMAGALFGLIFVAPLLLYGLAALSHLLARALGGRGSWFGARMALFWSLLASAPLILLNGLVAGFVGPGPALSLVGLAWLAVFAWFWIASLIAAERPGLAPA